LDVGEKCCSLAGDDDVEQRQSEKEKKKKKEKKQHRSTAQRSTKDAGEVREGRKVKE